MLIMLPTVATKIKTKNNSIKKRHRSECVRYSGAQWTAPRSPLPTAIDCCLRWLLMAFFHLTGCVLFGSRLPLA